MRGGGGRRKLGFKWWPIWLRQELLEGHIKNLLFFIDLKKKKKTKPFTFLISNLFDRYLKEKKTADGRLFNFFKLLNE